MTPNKEKISIRYVSNGYVLTIDNWSDVKDCWIPGDEFVFQDEFVLIDEIKGILGCSHNVCVGVSGR